MKILYYGDNRVRVNLGCRATSAALSMLISRKHHIVYRIKSELFLTQPPYSMISSLTFDLEKNISLIKKWAEIDIRYRETDLDIYEYDALVINAEGSMIMTQIPRLDTIYFLTVAYWARKKCKKIFFVNGMFSDCPVTGKNKETLKLTDKILSTCDFVSTRDPLSFRYVKENMSNVAVKYIPDALFTWKDFVEKDIPKNLRFFMPFRFESDNELTGGYLKNGYVIISGGSLAAWNQRKAFETYVPLVQKIKQCTSLPVILLQTCSGDFFLTDVAKATDTPMIPAKIPIVASLNLLAHATLYISGRYHPSIMASLGNVPCIFLKGNSHKNLGLQEMLAYRNIKEFSHYPSKNDIEEICRLSSEYISGKLELPTTVSIDTLCERATSLLDYIE